MREDPIKRYVLLILLQAQQDGATELVFAPASGERSPIKYMVDGTWYDMSSPPSDVMPGVMTELARLAGFTAGAKEGEICAAFGGTRLNWKITVVDGEGGFILTPD